MCKSLSDRKSYFAPVCISLFVEITNKQQLSFRLTVFSIKILKIFEVCCNSLIDDGNSPTVCSIKTEEVEHCESLLKNLPKNPSNFESVAFVIRA